MCAFMFFSLCLVAMAQGKLTPQARWTMTKHSYKAAQRAARAKAQGQSLVQDEARVTLVVKVDGADAVQTFAQLRKKGASSYGTMPNGVVQPVVCAPGVNIVSSWNHYALSEGEAVLDNMQWQGYPYSSATGTSMACPVVSGIIALWLQANSTLTLADIKEILRQTCTNDSFTAAYPTHWGYGKVNAAKGIEFIANMPQGIEKMNHEELRKKSTVIYDLQGRLVNGKLSKGLYIVNGKKVFVK